MDLEIAVVNVFVKKGMEDDFVKITLNNCKGSVAEEKNYRFDLIQSAAEHADYTTFYLWEIFGEGGSVAHKETQHYLTWREQAQDMMAIPRKGVKVDTLYPKDDAYTKFSKYDSAEWGSDSCLSLATYSLKVSPEQIEELGSIQKDISAMEGVVRFSLLKEKSGSDDARLDCVQDLAKCNKKHVWIFAVFAAGSGKKSDVDALLKPFGDSGTPGTIHFPKIRDAW